MTRQIAAPARGFGAWAGKRRRSGTRSARAESVDVAVIGAGQAGLSLSHELSQAGVEHVVLERGRVGQAWRRRWDSFCLVIPNWTVRLPGGHYHGGDPDGFMPRNDIVGHLVRYARSFHAPVREDTDVLWLGPGGDCGFLLETSAGNIRAREVVLASGAHQRPYRPVTAGFPESLRVIDADDYTKPAALPPGKVLVVGSGQTGCQLAEELTESGRLVYLACGRAPWLPRGSRAAMSSRGSPKPPTTTPLWPIFPARRHGWGLTPRPVAVAADTTSTTGRCRRWESAFGASRGRCGRDGSFRRGPCRIGGVRRCPLR